MEHGLHQAGAKHQHLAAGAGHRLEGGRGLRFHAPVHLTGHRGTHIKELAAGALAQGIGARRHRLGPQGSLGPARRHLTAHHAGQIALKTQMVDGQHLAALHHQLELAAIAALTQLEVAQGLALAQGKATGQRFQPKLPHADRRQLVGPLQLQLGASNADAEHLPRGQQLGITSDQVRGAQR